MNLTLIWFIALLCAFQSAQGRAAGEKNEACAHPAMGTWHVVILETHPIWF